MHLIILSHHIGMLPVSNEVGLGWLINPEKLNSSPTQIHLNIQTKL